jgi:4-hydroxymandelate oxidase
VAATDPAGFRTLGELEEVALARLEPGLRAYLQGGAGEERTLRSNREAFSRWVLLPRVLQDTTSLDLSTDLLGRRVGAPFYSAPTAYQGSLHPDGELATARAAGAADLLAVHSTLSTRSLEAIAEAAPGAPRWFQLYLQPRFADSLDLVARAERAGFGAIVLTVDMPIFPNRDAQLSTGFAVDRSPPLGNGPHIVPPSRVLVRGDPEYGRRDDAAATWETVEKLRAATQLPLVLKGILTASDADEAVRRGARAIVVSNHGGRQLDGAPASLDALPEVVAAVGEEAEVYVDGGFRRGSDLLIALALGARAVGIGRPVLYALAAGGEAGVSRLFELLVRDLATAMTLAGRPAVRAIDRGLVRRAP